MSDENKKTIRDYPIFKFSPFTKDTYLTDDNSFSVSVVPQKNKNEGTLRKLTGIHIIDKKDSIELIGNILKDKLNLTKCGIIIFKYLFEIYKKELKKSDDEHMTIKVNFDNCRDTCGYASTVSVWQGLTELLDKGIIARSGVPAVYYINPVFFNPTDTIALTEYYKIQA